MSITGPFTLPPLPYDPGALDPVISERAMKLHHEAHQGGYVRKLNALIERKPALADATLEQIIAKQKGSLFDCAAQVWNHTFFFRCLRPPRSGQISEGLKSYIASQFGSFDRFQSLFIEGALDIFGSGWMWLVQDKGRRLGLLATKDADLPMKHGSKALFCVDVWEHAYYLDYFNQRKRFLEAILANVVNWDFVADNVVFKGRS